MSFLYCFGRYVGHKFTVSIMISTLWCFAHVAQGFHLSAPDVCYSLVEKRFCVPLCHSFRERSILLFSSHWTLFMLSFVLANATLCPIGFQHSKNQSFPDIFSLEQPVLGHIQPYIKFHWGLQGKLDIL